VFAKTSVSISAEVDNIDCDGVLVITSHVIFIISTVVYVGKTFGAKQSVFGNLSI